MKLRYICLIIVLFIGSVAAYAGGHEFAVGINVGTSVTDGNGRYPEHLWQIGVRGEYRLNLVRPLWLNSMVDVDYTHFSSKDITFESPTIPVGFYESGATFQLTEYLNVRLPKGWGIGTGPAVRFDTFKYYSSNAKVKAYWTFGVEKTFIDKLTARLMWYQKLNDASNIYNQLNLSITYTF